ncbi:MAG: hypothetical protein NDF54_11670 [archaeon GB-1867-035]|nr:hypothetical protein [Candidatus Culexmicrobium profundum]
MASSRSIITAVMIISLLINAALAPLTFMFWLKNQRLMETINVLSQEVNRLSDDVNLLIQELNLTKQQLEYYRNQVNYYSSLIERGEGNLTIYGLSDVNLVAVKAIPKGLFSVVYEGVTLKCNVELIVGAGRILVNTSPKIGIDLQASARTAVLVAEKYTEVSLAKVDVIISIYADEPVDVVDGPSAGAAITSAIIAAIRGDKLNSSVYITGTINADGSIGPIGGVVEKAIAAAEAGGKLFLVPVGQSKVLVRVLKEYQIAPGVSVVVYRYKEVDLEDYLNEQGYKIRVVEVGNIEEAYRYLIESG